jgi:hypothetical protein
MLGAAEADAELDADVDADAVTDCVTDASGVADANTVALSVPAAEGDNDGSALGDTSPLALALLLADAHSVAAVELLGDDASLPDAVCRAVSDTDVETDAVALTDELALAEALSKPDAVGAAAVSVATAVVDTDASLVAELSGDRVSHADPLTDVEPLEDGVLSSVTTAVMLGAGEADALAVADADAVAVAVGVVEAVAEVLLEEVDVAETDPDADGGEEKTAVPDAAPVSVLDGSFDGDATGEGVPTSLNDALAVADADAVEELVDDAVDVA